jgi:hypothetical protein
MNVKRPGFFCCAVITIFFATGSCACKKGSNKPSPPANLTLVTITVNGISTGFDYNNVGKTPLIKFTFSSPVKELSVNSSFSFASNSGTAVPFTSSLADNDNTVMIQPSAALSPLSKYTVAVAGSLQSQSNGVLTSPVNVHLITAIDSSNKFPLLSDSALLTLVEQQTFKYFYDFGHPVSGLARERNSSADVVTTGGSGFGIMCLLVGIQRNFISRASGLARISQIVNFLTTKAHRYHGAFPHWMNGATGETVPFSPQDDGADLVETSYMLQGLLCARQFFNSSSDPDEIALRDSINSIWQGVDWQWFRQNGQDVLYWHWSPDMNWSINMKISGWDEALIVYVLAASASTDPIPKTVYDNGWARNGAIQNGDTYYGIQLPLGPPMGGPLFFAHYSFLGINPTNLSDAYANYWTQNTAHAQINYKYCVANPQGYYGYSNLCWGLTASDDNISGYSAHSPTNDLGIISPTAAISSLPYTPTESMNALKFFYYTLGDKLWGDYGFVDAFNLSNPWFATSYLAIDQGPEVVMIENYRSGLLWNLFMSCPEIKTGMKAIGFQSPQLN